MFFFSIPLDWSLQSRKDSFSPSFPTWSGSHETKTDQPSWLCMGFLGFAFGWEMWEVEGFWLCDTNVTIFFCLDTTLCCGSLFFLLQGRFWDKSGCLFFSGFFLLLSFAVNSWLGTRYPSFDLVPRLCVDSREGSMSFRAWLAVFDRNGIKRRLSDVLPKAIQWCFLVSVFLSRST